MTFQALIQKDVLAVLCCPLVQDPTGGIQCTALNSLAKLVDTDPLVGETVMGSGVLGAIVLGLSHSSPQVSMDCTKSLHCTQVSMDCIEVTILYARGCVPR